MNESCAVVPSNLLVYFLLCGTPWWFGRPIFCNICCDDFPIYCDSQIEAVRMALAPPEMTLNLWALHSVPRPMVGESAFEPIQVAMLSFVAKMVHHIRLVIENWNHNWVNKKRKNNFSSFESQHNDDFFISQFVPKKQLAWQMTKLHLRT